MKKKIRNAVAITVLVAVAALLAALPRLARSNAGGGTGAQILTAQVRRGELSETLAGGGTLTAEEAETVAVPTGVEITEYFVANGDYVWEGDAVAAVDRAEVMSAVLEVQNTVDELTARMDGLDDPDGITFLYARAPGRVKAIFAQPGENAGEVMLRDGALAVLSLDGLMAVDLPDSETAARTGQRVTVTASDGTSWPGTVESVLPDRTVVTLTDDGPVLNDTVTVSFPDGTRLGSGKLYIHSAWNLVATTGTVSSVQTAVGSVVYYTEPILTLRNTEHSDAFEQLSAQRREYEEKLQELFLLYQDGILRAPCEGYVSGVDKSLVKKLSADGGLPRLRLLSNAPDGGGDGAFHRVGMVTAVNADGTLSVRMQLADASVTDYTDLSGITTASSTMTLEGICAAAHAYAWTGSEWTDRSVTPGDVFVFAYDGGGNLLWMVYADHNGLPTQPGGAMPAQSGGISPSTPAQPGSTTFGISGTLPSGLDTSALTASVQASGSVSSSGASSFSGGLAEDTGLYDLDGTVVCSVTPGRIMTVNIPVDELDILKYRKGMEADITVDALPGEHYTGTVTQVGGVGTNSGGSSKFTVEVTLEAVPDMLAGMNASVVIPSETVDALLIPTAALNDKGSRSSVYTAYDKKNTQLTDPVEVVTGHSDGEYTEILSGLSEGQSVWYSYFGKDPAVAP